MMQIFIGGAVAFLVTVFFTPVLIKKFSAEGLGQEIREDGPPSHAKKRGTPSMGGVAIVAGIWSDRIGLRKPFVTASGVVMSSAAVLLAIVQTWSAALVGAVAVVDGVVSESEGAEPKRRVVVLPS